jgi:predicted kinase
MYIIILQGGPAVGKTQLAHRLVKDLDIGLLAKDDIKELLFDKIGLPADRNESRAYGEVTMKTLFMIADKMAGLGKDFIIESAFNKQLADSDLQALKDKHQCKMIQLYCYTDPETQLNRYNNRIADGTRHKGHFDQPIESSDTFVRFQESYPRLSLTPVIDVDTTNFGEKDYDSFLRLLKQSLND